MADLMAGVAATFLLLAAIFMVRVARLAELESARAREVAQKLEQITKSDDDAIEQLVRLRGNLERDPSLAGLVTFIYDAELDPFLLVIVLDSGRLRFDAGDCALRPETKDVIAATFSQIFRGICGAAASGFIESITLEGHTDNRPFFPIAPVCGTTSLAGCLARPGDTACVDLGFSNNIRLSAARAQNVFLEVRRSLAAEAPLVACLERSFVVAGRGPVEPLDRRDWRESRTSEENEKNRRVVIKVRATSKGARVERGTVP